jgi:hypothetical protein
LDKSKYGIKHVVVIKVYDVATSTSKFLEAEEAAAAAP